MPTGDMWGAVPARSVRHQWDTPRQRDGRWRKVARVAGRAVFRALAFFGALFIVLMVAAAIAGHPAGG